MDAHAQRGGPPPGLGRFSWELHAATPGVGTFAEIAINGLGSNPAASHFWLPSNATGSDTPAVFAFHDAFLDYIGFFGAPSQQVPGGWNSISGPPQFAALPSAPEPSTLILGGLAVGGFVIGRRISRRRVVSSLGD